MLGPQHNRRLLLEIEQKAATILCPVSQLKPSEWADEHRQLSREANARGGKWRSLPMQVAPMDSVIDPTVRCTVMMWASQTGKTEVINNIVGYFIEQDPAPMLMIQPDLNMAETWSKDRFSTMVRDTPVLRRICDDRSRTSGNTILHKTFPGGHLTIAGANSPASLASRPIRVNLFDEVDRYPASAGTEGDPILLSEKRSDTFWNNVSFKTSTPTVAKHSRIEKEFELSDKNYWHVCCPYCDHEQRLKWSQVKWDGDDDLSLENAYYQCESDECQEHWSDLQRIAAVRDGRWIASAPFKGVRGYHLNGIYSLFSPKKGFKTRLHQMAVEFLTNKKLGKDALKVWVNTFLAETWSDESDVKPDWVTLLGRVEKYDTSSLPLGVRMITAGCDFQADRIEVELVGHGVGEESWGLGHKVIWGDTRHPEIYNRLEALLIQEFKRVDGATLRLSAAGFDTGYAACQRQLYSWLRQRLARRYYAFKGSSVIDSEPISHSSKSKVETVRLIMVGTNRIKAYIYSRATISVPGPGYMHFPESYTQEWFKQLLVEDSNSVFRNGKEIKVFSMPKVTGDNSTDRNEALDLRVYAMAALYARGVPNWDFEERRNLLTIGSAEGPSVAQAAAPERQATRRKKPKSGRGSFADRLLNC